MSTDDSISSADPGHNRSAQHGGVDLNVGPALALPEQHLHAHADHGQTTLPSEKDDMMFAKSTEGYVGAGNAAAPAYEVRKISSNDEESGSGGIGEVRDETETAGRGKWTFKRLYAKYRLVFHFVIWAVWTS